MLFLRVVFACAILLIVAPSPHAQDSKSYNTITNMTVNKINEAMAGVIASVGEQCSRVTHTLIQGMDSEGSTHVSVRCLRAKDWAVSVKSDMSTSVVSCHIMKEVGHVPCWKPFDN